jgi:VCBS repeat-containing protein
MVGLREIGMFNGAFVASGGEFLVNTTVSGIQSDAAITALSGGGFVITWTDASASGGDTSGAAIRAQIYDSAGVKSGGEILINSATANAQTLSAVTALSTGGFVATWTDASLTGGDADGLAIKGRIFDASGTAVTGDFLVNTTTKLNQNNPAITSLASGGFVVSWTDASGIGDTKGTGVKAQIYSAAGTKVGGEFLVNTTTLNSQNYPALTGLAGGGFVATWMDSSGQGGDPTAPSVKAQLFSVSGAKVGSEFLVNTTVTASQDQPVITALSSGGFVIAWRDTSLQGDTSAAGIKAQIYDGTGARVGGEFQVNSTFLNTQDQPAISALPNGGFIATWHDNSLLSSDPSGYGIRSQVFDALGNKLGSEWVVDTSTAGNQEQPTVATLASGKVVVGWTDYSGAGGDTDGGIKAQIYAPTQGTITGLTLSSNQVSEAAVENVAVGTLQAAGALNAVYTYSVVDDSTDGAFGIDGTNLVVRNSLLLDYETASSATLTIRASDGFGNTFDQVYTLGITDAAVEHRFAGGSESLANTATASNQQQPAIAALQSGNYVLTWIDGSGVGGDSSNYGIKAQIVDAGGAKVGGEFLVNTQTLNSQDNPTVAALSSGGFVVTWSDASAIGSDTSNYGIKAQVFDGNGAAVGGEFLVNTQTLNAQKTPSVAALSSGGFVISWADLSLQGGDASVSSVKAQLYDAAGHAVGGEFLVNTNTGNGQDTPVVAGLVSGGFVVSWHDSSGVGGDSSKDAIKAQLFDSGGAKVGGEFLVNTQTQSNQQQEAITALSGGGFAIAWADASGRGGDTDNYGIKLQIFDASGAKVGGELLANTTIQGAQIAPSISALPNGDIIVSWSDYSGQGPEGGTPGVKAQIFTQDGARVGGEFIVNTTQLGSQTDPALAGGGDGGFAVVWTDASAQGGDDSGTSIKLKTFSPLPDQGGPPPVIAAADTVVGTEDQILTIDPATLLANDVSGTGLPLTITGVAAVSGGNIVIQPDGSLAFTPLPNFSGAALFTYTASDGTSTATGRVTVNVAGVNDPPIAVDDTTSISQNGGTILASALLANDTDADPGDHLSLVGVSGLTTLGAQLSIDQGNLTYAPGAMFQSLAAGQTATDTFSYTVSDTSGATATANVTLTVLGVDDAPTGLALSNASIDENAANGTLVGSLAATDVDQGDTLSFTLTDNAGGRFAVDPLTGALTVANGSLLDYETKSSYSVTARVADSSGLFTSSSFVISLNNLPEPRSWTGDNGANLFVAQTNDLWTINGLVGADTMTGNASSDTILGGAGADVLDGAGGTDMLVGGIGDDTYYVDNPADQIVENAGEGTDTVFSTSDYTLSPNIEKLTQNGTGNIAATGNDLANTINGNIGDNLLRGGNGGDLLVGNDGNDSLLGEAASDSLQGGVGNDTLVGGVGPDQLTGGTGQDTFVFDSLTVSTDFDTVKDFSLTDDRLSISSTAFAALAGAAGGVLPASAFRSGSQATTPDQHLIYNPSTGNLYYDPDGNGSAAMVQIAFFSTKPLLGAANFTVT